MNLQRGLWRLLFLFLGISLIGAVLTDDWYTFHYTTVPLGVLAAVILWAVVGFPKEWR